MQLLTVSEWLRFLLLWRRFGGRVAVTEALPCLSPSNEPSDYRTSPRSRQG